MITTKRQVSTEQDRYGGYSQPVNRIGVDNSTEKSMYSGRSQFEAQGHDFSLMRGETETIRYTPRRETLKEADTESIGLKETSRPIGYISPLAPRRLQKPRNREDVMPSIKKEYVLSEQEAKREKGSNISFKAKVMLAIYVAVVIALAAVVIGTGYAISAATEKVTFLEQEFQQKTQYVLAQESEIAMLEDETYNIGRATQNGMVKIDDDIVLIEASEPIQPMSYESRTNWFDRFCDFITKLAGG